MSLCSDVSDVIAKALKHTDPANYPPARVEAWLLQFQELMHFKIEKLSRRRTAGWPEFHSPADLAERVYDVVNKHFPFGTIANGEDLGGKAMRGLSFFGKEFRYLIDEGVDLDLTHGLPANRPAGVSELDCAQNILAFQKLVLTILDPSAYTKPEEMVSFLHLVDDVAIGLSQGTASPQGLWALMKGTQTPQGIAGNWYQMLLMKRRGMGKVRKLEGFSTGSPIATGIRGLDIEFTADIPIRYVEAKYGEYLPSQSTITQVVDQLQSIVAESGTDHIKYYRVMISGLEDTDAAAHATKAGGRMLRYIADDTMVRGSQRLPWPNEVRAPILDMLRAHMGTDLGGETLDAFLARTKRFFSRTAKPAELSEAEWASVEKARTFIGESFFQVEKAPEIHVNTSTRL